MTIQEEPAAEADTSRPVSDEEEAEIGSSTENFTAACMFTSNANEVSNHIAKLTDDLNASFRSLKCFTINKTKARNLFIC